ncbi:hypothetical protein [Streptomyces sp. NPDC101166]|uniref:hypothetical protein n=1 Tax=Streptomyces sp. NPDC101166 TaxID=3366120 RepID=UPI00380A40E4
MPVLDRKSRRRRPALIFAGIVTTLAVGVSAGIAWAAVTDNMHPTANNNLACFNDPEGGDGRLSCRTDNATVTYYMDSNGPVCELESEDKNAVTTTMGSDYSPTDLTISYDSSPTFEGSAETDIVYQECDAGVPSTADGVTWCNDAVDNAEFECDQQYVRLRGPGSYTRGLTCHETGHAIGLTHGKQADPILSNTDSRLGCLVTPVGSNVGLGANNRDNINGQF